jgi:ankyrin repeat protein
VLHEAGADLNPSMDDGETPLHWAASNDDVELVDALLDAGADIEAPGSVIGGLGPIADAAVFGGRRAGLRLVERGARTNIYQAAALGLIDRVRADVATEPGPDAERLTTAFWAACGAGHLDVAKLLLSEGAEINWVGWGDQTPLDVAQAAEATELVGWLQEHGARSAAEIPN